MPEPQDSTASDEQIGQYVMVKTPLGPADLAFVFGTRHGITNFADQIATYWHKDFFPWILIAGGPTRGHRLAESDVLKNALVDRGVAPDRIICERRSTNTGQNVEFSLPIIDQHLGLQNVRSLIAVGKVSSSRRYLMTLERHWPGPKKMILPINYFTVAEHEWTRDPDFKSRVLAEWEKIPRYEQTGFLKDIASLPPRPLT
jgi:uncharacterized SAM-binding protein YcdF (DUF218 family)